MIALLFTILIGSGLTWCLPFEAIDGIDGDSNLSEGQYGDYFEGDMILSEEQLLELRGHGPRNGMNSTKYRWPNNTVVYQFESNHTEEERKTIEMAMREIERSTSSCVTFKERTNENNYVAITSKNTGCHAAVGYQGSRQELNLDKINENKTRNCIYSRTIIHELMHTLGFFHMQCAYDRDDFVTVYFENIKENQKHNFDKYDKSVLTHFNQTYDLKSIMHYSKGAFTKNGLPTIVPHEIQYLDKIGKYEKLSKIDIIKLKAMYQC